jgi:hypothetical protein
VGEPELRKHTLNRGLEVGEEVAVDQKNSVVVEAEGVGEHHQ